MAKPRTPLNSIPPTHKAFQGMAVSPTPSLTQPAASTLLLVKDWLHCHGNGPSSEGSVTSQSYSGPCTAFSAPAPWTELFGGTQGE